MSLGSSLGNAGARYPLEYAGRLYHASFVVQRVKTAFSMWLKARAYAPIRAMEAAGAAPATIDRAVRAYCDRVEAGEFEFDAERARSLLDPARFSPEALTPGPDGSLPAAAREAVAAAVALVAILFETTEEVAMGMLADKPREVETVLGLVFKESFGRPKEPEGARAQASHPLL